MGAILLAAYLAPGWVPSEWNSRKNSVHMRAEAEASGDGEGAPLGNLEV